MVSAGKNWVPRNLSRRQSHCHRHMLHHDWLQIKVKKIYLQSAMFRSDISDLLDRCSSESLCRRRTKVFTFAREALCLTFIRASHCLRKQFRRSDLIDRLSIGQLAARQLVNQLEPITRVASFRGVQKKKSVHDRRTWNLNSPRKRTWRTRAPRGHPLFSSRSLPVCYIDPYHLVVALNHRIRKKTRIRWRSLYTRCH